MIYSGVSLEILAEPPSSPEAADFLGEESPPVIRLYATTYGDG